MALVYLGSLTVGAVCPGLSLALASSITRIQAELTGQEKLIAQLNLVPPTIAGSLSSAKSIVASITAAAALGVEVPSLTLQVTAAAALIAALNLELAPLLAMQNALGVAGVHAYVYDGTAAGLGPSLPSAFPGGVAGDHANALVLATTVPAAWAALGAVLKTS